MISITDPYYYHYAQHPPPTYRPQSPSPPVPQSPLTPPLSDSDDNLDTIHLD